jgi:hypothetical protein
MHGSEEINEKKQSLFFPSLRSRGTHETEGLLLAAKEKGIVPRF